LTDEPIAVEQLKNYIARAERLEEDRANVGADLREVYAEAKSEGFDPKIMRKLVRIRRQDKRKAREEQAVLDLYLEAIGG
jgi:uncharacterized protein (UPF0335 family)